MHHDSGARLVNTISSPSADNLFGFCSVFVPHRARSSRFEAAAACMETPRFVEVQYRPWFLGVGSFPWRMVEFVNFLMCELIRIVTEFVRVSTPSHEVRRIPH
jgi:hypothetical protein